jgi:hypothetical protein
MFPRSLTTNRLVIIALVLLLAVLACNLPSAPGEDSGPPVENEMPPAEEVVNEHQQEDPPETPPEEPTPPTVARISGLSPYTTLVWWLSTYNLVIDRSTAQLQTLDLQAPILSPLGMPAEMGAFRPAGTGLGITLTGETSAGMEAATPGIILIDLNAAVRHVPAPENDGDLVGAAWSPDNTTIAWLYDVTVVAPNAFDPEACTEAAGCVGRVYDLVLTDSSGSGAQTILTHVVKSTNFPHLQMDHWRDDSAALFLKINSHIPSNLYEDQGGAPLQVDVPSGALTVLDENYLGSNVFVSPDGRWLAWNNDIDERIAVRILGPNSAACELFFPDAAAGKFTPLAFSLIFSPESTHLAWLDVTPSEDISADQLNSIVVRIMDLSGCEPDTLMELAQPLYKDDLPHLTGWLSDRLLMVSTHHDTKVLDTTGGTWVDFEWPRLTDPATLAGAVGY